MDLIPTGMELNVNAIQDSSMSMVNVFLWLLPLQFAQLMLALTEFLVFVKMDFMKSQDITAKDVPMDKFGMDWNAASTPLAHQDIHSTIRKTNVIQKLSIVDKIQSGMELCVFVIKVTIHCQETVSNVLQTQHGTERAAILKFQ